MKMITGKVITSAGYNFQVTVHNIKLDFTPREIMLLLISPVINDDEIYNKNFCDNFDSVLFALWKFVC